LILSLAVNHFYFQSGRVLLLLEDPTTMDVNILPMKKNF
jgi:hypothetical protein